MYTQVNQYHVIMEVAPYFQADPDRLNHIYILANASNGSSGPGAATSFAASGSSSAGSNALSASPEYSPSSTILAPPSNALSGSPANSGAGSAGAPSSAIATQVPLSAFCTLQQTTEPLSINHQGQFPAVTVSFNLAPDASLGTAISTVEKIQKGMHMPASVQAGFEGTAASFESSLSNEPLLILAALITVYIVLGVLYENYIHPITILSTLPSAGVGAFIALMLFHQDLNIVAIIGLVLLIGIVKKNGIMIVDFALQAERERGKDSTEAVYEACLLRFRPIMMTTMAALLAGVPLAFGTGLGSELRRPLGITMIGGLIVSQALTLYTTPVIYIFFDKFSHRISRRSAEAEGTEPEVPEPA
jgi:multidrug efflux pump